MRRIIKRIITGGILFFILLFIGGVLFSIVYQDKIVNLFINESNKYLLTPIKVDKIRFSVLEQFPHMAIVMENVYMGESIEGSKEPLGVVRKVYLSFSLFTLLKGSYEIDEITLKEAIIKLKVLANGKQNYNIFKPQPASGKGELQFNIDQINLEDVGFTYHDLRRDQVIDLEARTTKASLNHVDSMLFIKMQGNIFSKEITINKQSYFRNKPLDLATAFSYQINNQLLKFEASELTINNGSFLVDGTYQIDKSDRIDLRVDGKNTNIKTIISLLPESTSNKLSKYESKGNLYFNAAIKGTFEKNKSPGVNIVFGCNDVTFNYPSNNKKIKNVFLNGEFVSSDFEDLSKAKLSLENVNAQLDGEKIVGRLVIDNFKNTSLDCELDGLLNVNSVIAFFPLPQITHANGMLDIDVKFKGNVRDFKGGNGIKQVSNSGQISLQNISFKLSSNKLDFSNFNGRFDFNNNDLVIENFSAQAGNSRFNFNGNFKNFLAQLLSKNQPLIIEAELQSSNIDLDELLTSEYDTELDKGKSGIYYFDITPRLNLNFNCKVDYLKFRRFRGNNISGALSVRNQIANTDALAFETAGGKVRMAGTVDTRSKQDINIHTLINFDHINIDSAFYIFEDFNQTFLEHRHLKGQIYSTINTSMRFNKNLKWYPNSLIADVETSIVNGELNNFEPMQRVAKYVRRESLDHLRFSEIKNNIHIEDQIIMIPPMEVSSNVRTIQLQGTHTFGQLIKYDLKLPIRNHDEVDKDAAFGAIEVQDNGYSNLFLSILGSTSEYQVIYDKRAVASKIKMDIKKEGKELKEIMNNKGKQKQSVELNEDEYFDFDSLENDRSNN